MNEPVYPSRPLTRRGVIREVAVRWKAQYYHGGTWNSCMSGSAQVIYEKLLALDLDTAPREAVDAIIGNASWTAIQCTGCREDVDVAAEVGEPSDYDSATVTLCAACIALAAQCVSPTEPS